VLKDRVMHVADFLEAVRRVADGGTALDPEVVSQLFSRRRGDGASWRSSTCRSRRRITGACWRCWRISSAADGVTAPLAQATDEFARGRGS
jgi:hypothetical protein